MQNEAKITCYQELYAKLKESDLLSAFGWPAQKEHLDFYFNIGNTKIFFRIFSNKDMMQIRSETDCKETQDEENIALAQEISKNFYGIFGTAYDGKIIFNLSVPFPSVSDDAGKQLIVDKTNYFINMVTSQLEIEFVAKVKEEKERAQTIEEAEKNKKRKIGFFQKKNSDSEEAYQNHEEVELPTVPEVITPEKAEFELTLGAENTPDLKVTDQYEDMIPHVEETDSNDAEDMIAKEVTSEENVKPALEAERKKEKESEEDKKDLLEKSVDVLSPPVTPVINNEPEDSDIQEEISIEEKTTIMEQEAESMPAVEQSETIIQPGEEKPGVYDISKEETVMPRMDSESTPSASHAEGEISAREMKHISEFYESMNRTFSMRKNQLDYREQMLAEQKQILKHERENVKEEKAALKAQHLEIKGKEDSLKKNWEQYKKAKKRQEQLHEKLDEREKKVNNSESIFSDKEQQLQKQEELLILREQELTKKQEELEQYWKDYQEKSSTLANYEERLESTKQELTENELKLDMQKKQNAMERQTIEEKLLDLKEMEEMIEQMKKESGIRPFTSDTEELEKLKEERNQLLHQTELMQEELISKAMEMNQVSEQLQNEKKAVSSLEKSYDELKAEFSNIENASSEESEQIEILKGHIGELESKNKETELRYHKQVLGLQERYDSLLHEHGALKEKLDSMTPPDVVKELTKGGFTVQNGEKNNQKLLTFTLGGCKIWIDEEIHIVEIEKETKRNYTKQMQNLNDMAHDVSFCAGKGKVYCRFVYHDIVKEIRDNIAIMVKFK